MTAIPCGWCGCTWGQGLVLSPEVTTTRCFCCPEAIIPRQKKRQSSLLGSWKAGNIFTKLFILLQMGWITPLPPLIIQRAQVKMLVLANTNNVSCANRGKITLVDIGKIKDDHIWQYQKQIGIPVQGLFFWASILYYCFNISIPLSGIQSEEQYLSKQPIFFGELGKIVFVQGRLEVRKQSDRLICNPVLASCFLLKEQIKTSLNNPRELWIMDVSLQTLGFLTEC